MEGIGIKRNITYIGFFILIFLLVFFSNDISKPYLFINRSPLWILTCKMDEDLDCLKKDLENLKKEIDSGDFSGATHMDLVVENKRVNFDGFIDFDCSDINFDKFTFRYNLGPDIVALYSTPYYFFMERLNFLVNSSRGGFSFYIIYFNVEWISFLFIFALGSTLLIKILMSKRMLSYKDNSGENDIKKALDSIIIQYVLISILFVSIGFISTNKTIILFSLLLFVIFGFGGLIFSIISWLLTHMRKENAPYLTIYMASAITSLSIFLIISFHIPTLMGLILNIHSIFTNLTTEKVLAMAIQIIVPLIGLIFENRKIKCDKLNTLLIDQSDNLIFILGMMSLSFLTFSLKIVILFLAFSFYILIVSIFRPSFFG